MGKRVIKRNPGDTVIISSNDGDDGVEDPYGCGCWSIIIMTIIIGLVVAYVCAPDATVLVVCCVIGLVFAVVWCRFFPEDKRTILELVL